MEARGDADVVDLLVQRTQEETQMWWISWCRGHKRRRRCGGSHGAEDTRGDADVVDLMVQRTQEETQMWWISWCRGHWVFHVSAD
jgi:hypothetical protein